jgi:ABC-2 type transport system permease protein
VLYSTSAILEKHKVPGWIKEVYACNPFTAILGFYRSGVYAEELPSAGIAAKGTIVSVLLFVLGIWIFRKLEPAVLKEI